MKNVIGSSNDGGGRNEVTSVDDRDHYYGDWIKSAMWLVLIFITVCSFLNCGYKNIYQWHNIVKVNGFNEITVTLNANIIVPFWLNVLKIFVYKCYKIVDFFFNFQNL